MFNNFSPNVLPIIRYVEKCGVARGATDVCGAENMGFTCRITKARIMTPL